MSFSTVRVPKNQLEAKCPVCLQEFEAENTIANAFRSKSEKRAKVVAHKVDDLYHAFQHPGCFQQIVEFAQNKGKSPECPACRAEIDTIDDRSLADPDAIIDNGDRAVADRGRSLIATMNCDLVFDARSKKHEIQKILAGGKVPLKDLNSTAVIAAQKVEFECIPLFLARGLLFPHSKNRIVEYALEYFDWPTVRLFLPLGISENVQEQALQRLAQCGDLETMTALLQQRSQEGRRFPQAQMEAAVAQTSERGEPELTRALLDHQSDLSEEGYARAIWYAIRSEDPAQSREVVQLILDRACLSGCTRSAAIAKAIAKCRFDIAWDMTTYSMSSCSVI